jgi:hypothetical protein
LGHAGIKSVLVINATSKPGSRNPVPEKKEKKTACLFIDKLKFPLIEYGAWFVE